MAELISVGMDELMDIAMVCTGQPARVLRPASRRGGVSRQQLS
jgi:hypothetical protein